jgi:hypothetical protein
MNTEELIIGLAKEAGAVRRLPNRGTRLAGWLILALAAGAIGLMVHGLRPDYALVLGDPSFLFAGALAIVITVTGASAALILSVPGAEQRRFLRSAATLAGGIWIVFAIGGVISAGRGFADAAGWDRCAAGVVATGLVPALGLLAMLRRGYPLAWGWPAGLAVAAALAVGSTVISLGCPISAASHLLLGHVAPVGVLALAAAFVASLRRAL